MEFIEGEHPVGDRAAYLLENFGRRIDFLYRGNAFAYVHIDRLAPTVSVGRLGRKEKEITTDAPETGYAPLEREGYRAVNLFLNISQDTEGQKIALQVDTKVGSPRVILEALIGSLNSNPDAPWQIEIHPIIDQRSFWDAVSAHRSEITNLKLKLVAPNILGFTDSVANEMKHARDENNAATVTVSLDNKDGLRLETDSIRAAIKYVSAGGGDAILRGKRRKFFDSSRKQTNISVVGDAPAARGMRDILSRIMGKLFGQ